MFFLQGLELGQCSAPSSLVMPGTHHWSSSFSHMPSWDLPCLRLWVYSVLWWLSCCYLHSKRILVITYSLPPRKWKLLWGFRAFHGIIVVEAWLIVCVWFCIMWLFEMVFLHKKVSMGLCGQYCYRSFNQGHLQEKKSTDKLTILWTLLDYYSMVFPNTCSGKGAACIMLSNRTVLSGNIYKWNRDSNVKFQFNFSFNFLILRTWYPATLRTVYQRNWYHFECISLMV